ncbi:MAG: radical SAM protein [Chitinophagaceae bacterium]|nr:MAG: radical SAM protein [Chitinophagaceae bacterium]
MSKETKTATLSEGRVAKIIQVHPSLQCNLFCKHCYSSSAPSYKEGLAVGPILRILEEGRSLGYNVVSLSGGEPFLYRSLETLLTESRSMGYFNSVTTNGMLLKSATARRILQQLDLIAFSIDGKEPEHDNLRGLDGAYQKMLEGVEVAKEYVSKFGFIHTVQPQSWTIFPWLAKLAIEKGAALLHLHPLELAGRAGEYFHDLKFGNEDLHKTYITHYYLQSYFAEELYIQLDLLHKDHIEDNPSFCFHAQGDVCQLNDFSSLFRELIIDEKGDILPIAHGCSPYFRLGNIEERLPLADMISRFMQYRFTELMDVYKATYDEIVNDPEKEIFNWSELVLHQTQQYSQVLVENE